MIRAKRFQDKVRYYDECREFARIVTDYNKQFRDGEFIIKTGGGPGIMEAANRGAYDAGGKSMALNITLPFEQTPNSYITPGMCFQFNYFAIRKMHFLLRTFRSSFTAKSTGTESLTSNFLPMKALFRISTLSCSNTVKRLRRLGT